MNRLELNLGIIYLITDFPSATYSLLFGENQLSWSKEYVPEEGIPALIRKDVPGTLTIFTVRVLYQQTLFFQLPVL